MKAYYISLLPEITLLLGSLIMMLTNHFRNAATPKTNFTIAKISLFLSMVLSIIFYNQSFWPEYFKNTPYTTASKVLIDILALVSFYLGCKWFLSKNRSSLNFYLSAVISVLLLSLSISAQNLLVMLGCLDIAFLLNLVFIKLYPDAEDVSSIMHRYIMGFIIMNIFCLVGLYLMHSNGISFDFAAAKKAYKQITNPSFREYLSVVLIIITLFYMLGVAPFHFWFANVQSVSILPVSMFLSFIPPLAYISILINVLYNVFYPLFDTLHVFIIGCGILSVILGAVGVNGESNLRKMFSYVSLYNLGAILLCFADFKAKGIFTGFVCLIVYILALLGVYTVFYAFKRKGEYLTDITSLSGVSNIVPYASASFLIFMVSLLGTPPMLGFLGKLSLINYLIVQGNYAFMGILLMATLLMAYAFLNVIKTIYFDKSESGFDRVDKGVYICLTINLFLVLISILNPSYLLHDAEPLLTTVL